MGKRSLSRLRSRLWHQYVWERQTLAQLAVRYGRSIRWVQYQLDQVTVSPTLPRPQPIVAVTDTTFFGRSYGLLVVRCPNLKRNVYWHEVRAETPPEYQRARQVLAAQGYQITAAVIDGKRGVREIFEDIPVQLCQFHQMATIRRYLTTRPKLPAGQELRAITLALPALSEAAFSALLAEWFTRWQEFLQERTYAPDDRHWQYTHRRLRSAYRSLHTNLPYLFTYQRYPQLKIPNTANSLDGYFARLKELLRVHRGQTIQRRYRMIQEILSHQH